MTIRERALGLISPDIRIPYFTLTYRVIGVAGEFSQKARLKSDLPEFGFFQVSHISQPPLQTIGIIQTSDFG